MAQFGKINIRRYIVTITVTMPTKKVDPRHIDASYFKEVLQQVAGHGRQSTKGVCVVQDLVAHARDCIVKCAVSLCESTPRKTITARDVQTAVRLLVPGELAKHAVSEATKAITRYSGDWESAGLKFPVEPQQHALGMAWREIVGEGAPIYLTATIEYLASEILELTHQATRDSGKRIYTPRHVFLAVSNDDELSALFSGCLIAIGGVRQQGVPVMTGGATTRGEDITRASLRRIMDKAGVRSVQSAVYDQCRGMAAVFLDRLINQTCTRAQHHRRITLKDTDVREAAKSMGIPIMGVFVDNNNKPLCTKVSRPHRGKGANEEAVRRRTKRAQQEVCHMIPKASFRRLTREILSHYMRDSRVSEKAHEAMQFVTEHYMLVLLYKANLCATHAKRRTLRAKDLLLVRNIMEYSLIGI